MTIMVFLYVRMGLRIRRTGNFGKNNPATESKQAQSKRAILKMLGELREIYTKIFCEVHEKIV